MNEEQKNIETCLAENILSEVANVPTDPQFCSLTDEALDPLKQQALRQAGYDGYEKVVWTHKPYTFTSQVKQMKSNLIMLLRRLWRYPFGSGTSAASAAGSSAYAAGSSAYDAGFSASAAAPIRSLADMWQHYITRLKGNPEYSIPSRLSQLTDLPSAPALLADRDMSSGIRFGTNPLPDGMSLVNLLTTDARLLVTELQDDNRGGALTSNAIFSLFPNVTKASIGGSSYSIVSGVGYNGYIKSNNTLKEVYFLGLKSIRLIPNDNGLIYSCDNLEIVECENLSNIVSGFVNTAMFWGNQPKLWKLKLGKITGSQVIFCGNSGAGRRPKLIHLEFGEGTNVSLSSLQYWNPSYILSDNPTGTDLIEEGSTATNNLQQFLQNFKTYIAERLTDEGTGLTLTLSQEVRNAIHAAEDEYGIENIIITQKGWTISPAPN